MPSWAPLAAELCHKQHLTERLRCAASWRLVMSQSSFGSLSGALVTNKALMAGIASAADFRRVLDTELPQLPRLPAGIPSRRPSRCAAPALRLLSTSVRQGVVHGKSTGAQPGLLETCECPLCRA